MKHNTFTRKQFDKLFPNEQVCLDWAMALKHNGGVDDEGIVSITCPFCEKVTKFYKVKSKKSYACGSCRHQVAPLSKTIFHKSSTSFKDWLFAIYLFANSRNGVSVMEIQRHTGVTYKTAWRMAKQIRLLFAQSKDILSDTVEVDEMYVGGRGKNNKQGRGAEHKTPVIGLVERQGILKAQVADNTKASTIIPAIQENVGTGSKVMTDKYRSYSRVKKFGYDHQIVNHSQKKYVVGDAQTNTLEGFWSQMKRSIDGTYHCVSSKYL